MFHSKKWPTDVAISPGSAVFPIMVLLISVPYTRPGLWEIRSPPNSDTSSQLFFPPPLFFPLLTFYLVNLPNLNLIRILVITYHIQYVVQQWDRSFHFSARLSASIINNNCDRLATFTSNTTCIGFAYNKATQKQHRLSYTLMSMYRFKWIGYN